MNTLDFHTKRRIFKLLNKVMKWNSAPSTKYPVSVYMVDKNTYAHSIKSRTCFQLIRMSYVWFASISKQKTAISELKSATFYAWKHFGWIVFFIFFHACSNGFLFHSRQTFINVMFRMLNNFFHNNHFELATMRSTV